jgi:hypothetical protein
MNTTIDSTKPVALVSLIDADKVKMIRKELGDRTAFETTETQTAYEQAEKHVSDAAAKTDSFHGLPIFTGKDIETATRLVVATVGVRDKDAKRNGYKAIVIFQQSSVADFLADSSEEAQAFVAKLIEREATDVAFSGIRGAESDIEMQTIMAGLPISIADIVTVSRATSGAGNSIFDTDWADFRKGVLAEKYARINAALPQKPEFIKALRSASYARSNPATSGLEAKDYIRKIGELFVTAVEAISPTTDTSVVKEWIAGREELNLDFSVKVVDMDDLEVLDL